MSKYFYIFTTTIACFIVSFSGCQTPQSLTCAIPDKSTNHSIEPKEILATDISFDSSTGEIKYTLPEPALVRIRIGITQGGALLRHLLDWDYRDAGAHVEVWDMKDETGTVNFTGRTDLMLVLSCRAVGSGPKDVISMSGLRKAPRVDVGFPKSTETTEDGIVVIRDIMPVRVTLDKEDQKWITETKFEVGLFIDNVFLMEDEEGANPFTYQLNTRGLNEGIHTITVNIVGYQGEVGTKSVLMYIKK